MKTLLVCAVLLLTASRALAVPILNPANGHYYELVTTGTPLTWDQANAATTARFFAGGPGYLATVVSPEEQAFVSTTFNFAAVPGNGTYIGGFQSPGSQEPAGGWRWVTGEPGPVAPNYTNWGLNEPNNLGGNEDVIEYVQNTTNKWNDISRNNVRQAYLVEYTPQATPVPEPSALLVAVTGVGSLLGWGWLRRKWVASQVGVGPLGRLAQPRTASAVCELASSRADFACVFPSPVDTIPGV